MNLFKLRYNYGSRHLAEAMEIVWKLKDKGRRSALHVHIPVSVTMNDRAALLGAAYYAMKLLETL